MRIAHLADVHLGLRRYYRVNPDGSNQREGDVMRAFTSAIDQILAAKVDLVLIAGDFYDKARPTNVALVESYRQMRRLHEAGIPVVLIGGNHDTPITSYFGSRGAAVGSILDLMAEFPNVRVVTYGSAAVRVGNVNVFCWPHGAQMNETNRPEIDGSAEWNVFLAHIELDAAAKPWAYSNWDYVALGDYHVAREVDQAVCFSGSLEYSSSNPWGELIEERERGIPGKGWLLVELRRNEFPIVEFQPVPTRSHVDLPAIDCTELTPADVDLLLRQRMAGPEIDGAVVRQVITNCRRNFQHDLNHEAIRSYKARTLHLHLDCRRAVKERTLATPLGNYRPGMTLADLVAEKLATRPLPPEIAHLRAEFVELGRKFMTDVPEKVSAKDVVAA